MGGRGSLRADGAWGNGGRGGLEVWNKGAGAWGGSKGLGGWGLERAEGLGSRGGAGPSGDVRTDGRTDVRSFARSLVRSFVRSLVRTDGRTDGKFTPLSYRTSSPSGPLPKMDIQ